MNSLKFPPWLSGFEHHEKILDREQHLLTTARILGVLLDQRERVERRSRGRSRSIRFGYSYEGEKIRDAPEWIEEVVALLASRVDLRDHESITLNEYPPHETISPHVDAEIFDDLIATLSLGGDATLYLHSDPTLSQSQSVILSAGDLFVLQGSARRSLHSVVNGSQMRWSIVFRKLIRCP